MLNFITALFALIFYLLADYLVFKKFIYKKKGILPSLIQKWKSGKKVAAQTEPLV